MQEISYEDYEDLWKEYEKIQQDGRYEDAKSHLDSIEKKATIEGNNEQLLKSIFYRYTLSRVTDETPLIDHIGYTENRLSLFDDPSRLIAYSYLGELYAAYYNENRYRLSQLTNITSADTYPEELSRYSALQILNRASAYYNMSTNPSISKSIPINTYNAIIGNLESEKGMKLRATLNDLLAHRAIDYFTNQYSTITEPTYAFVFDQKFAFGSTADFIASTINSQDSTSAICNALKLLQELERSKQNDQEEVLLDVILKRLKFTYNKSSIDNKKELYVSALKNLLEQYQQQEHSIYVAEELLKLYMTESRPILLKNIDEQKESDRAIAYKLIQELKDKYNTKTSQDLLTYYESSILTKELNFQSEDVVPINENFPILLQYKNIERIELNIYQLSDDDRMQYYQREKAQNFMTSKRLVYNRNFQLPKQDDFNKHNIELPVEGLKQGSYFLKVTDSDKQVSSWTYFHVSNLGGSMNNNEFLQVFDRLSGAPLKVNLTAYSYEWSGRKRELSKAFTNTTNSEGTCYDIPSGKSYLFDISTDNDRLFTNNYVSSYNNRGNADRKTITIFSDRAIYRPGQVIYYKAIADQQAIGGEPQLITDQEFNVTLYDANGQVVEKVIEKTNNFGSINGTFNLPKNTLNGNFRIQISTDNYKLQNTIYLKVEEYKRPSFLVETDTTATTYKLDQDALVSGYAETFTGSPISDAKLSYKITRKTNYYGYRWYNPTPSKLIKVGETRTNSAGKYNFSFLAEADPQSNVKDNPSFNYEIEITVTDAAGETRSTVKSIIISTKSILIKQANSLTISSTDKAKLKIEIADLQGRKTEAEVLVKIEELEPLTRNYRERYWTFPEDLFIAATDYPNQLPSYSPSTTDLSTRSIKRAISTETKMIDRSITLDLSALKDGVYKLTSSGKDAYEAVTYLTIFKDQVPKEITLSAIASSPIAEVETIAKIDIHSSIPNQPVYIDIVRTTGVEKRKIITLGNIQTIEIPVKRSDRGGILVKVTAVINNRFIEQDVNIDVPYSRKKLQLKWETIRDKVYPGSQEKWRLKISDKDGLPVVAEVLSSMYDASLDQFYELDWSGFNYNGLRFYFAVNPMSFEGRFANQINERNYIDYPNLNIVYPVFGTMIQTQYGNAYPMNKRAKLRGSRSMDLEESAMEAEAPQAEMSEVSVVADSAVADDGLELSNESNDPSNKKPEAKSANIRSNLRETVFFFPKLVTDNQGSTFLEFTMNEALTEWKLRTFAHTEQAQFTIDEQQIKTYKDLMVFPNGPRFFRQGDNMTMLAKVQNQTENELLAKANIKFIDTETGKDITALVVLDPADQSLRIAGKGETKITWNIKIPTEYTSLTYEIFASANDFTDGERNVAVVVPNRQLVTESIAISIKSNNKKTVEFEALQKLGKSETLDPKLVQFSVTSNPSWLAVQSLPYLMEYQYNCSEQIFSRYFANKLGQHILDQNPRIESVYQSWTENEQLQSPLHKNEQLKSALIAQTPWVMDALNEEEQMQRMSALFDRDRMNSESLSDLKSLQERQNGGGFPWFPGGRPNWYITQYILQGFGQLNKMGVLSAEDIQQNPIIANALQFIDQELVSYYKKQRKPALNSLIIHYLYVRSFYPTHPIAQNAVKPIDTYTKLAVDQWLEFPLMNQAQLALYFHRKDNTSMSEKIMESLRQRSLYKESLGRYWKETNGYFWYQSNIEMQSKLIEAFTEISNNDEEVDEMKQWLLSNKQTNRWKSTKATTQAIYAIVERGEKWIDNDEVVTLKIAGKKVKVPQDELVTATGQYEVKYRNEEISRNLEKVEINNPNEHTAWASASFQYIEELDKIQEYNKTPLTISRNYYKKTTTNAGTNLSKVDHKTALQTGDLLTVRITLKVDRAMEFIHLKDMRAAGTEPIDVLSGYRWKGGLGYYMETKDIETNFFVDYLPTGEYILEYDQRIVQPGIYSAGLSTVQSMYAPEFGAHSAGIELKISN